MIQYIEKDITTVTRGVVAHGVNCSGAMNSGVAKAIRNRWPDAYKRFLAHPKGWKALGEVDFIYIFQEDVVVANCYTQLLYGYDGGRYADVDAILKTMRRVMQIAYLQSYPVYIPRMGCGLGGLIWHKHVEPVIEEAAESYNKIHVYVCDLPENTNEPTD